MEQETAIPRKHLDVPDLMETVVELEEKGYIIKIGQTFNPKAVEVLKQINIGDTLKFYGDERNYLVLSRKSAKNYFAYQFHLVLEVVKKVKV